MEEPEQENPRSVGPYVITGSLGSGSFATVYSATHSSTQITCALKCISKNKLKNKEDFGLLKREVNLMKALDHPFVATLYEVLEDELNLYLSMEYVENGNLLDCINANKGLQEEQARRIFVQLIAALDYLHNDCFIVHRDLKAENVLLDRYSNVRLADFGLSKAFTKVDPFMVTTCGSPAYLAPEIINEQPYTAAADLWSAGVLLYAMVVGSLPFSGANISGLLSNILNTNPTIPNNLSPELRHLLQRLLIKDPKLRITLKEIEAHPWFIEYEDSKILDEKFGLIEALKVITPAELDVGVLCEMRISGYDTAGLLTELSSGKLSARTAAYKMLKKERAAEEINHWQKFHENKVSKAGTEEQMRMPILSQQTIDATTKKEIGQGRKNGSKSKTVCSGATLLMRTRKSQLQPVGEAPKPY